VIVLACGDRHWSDSGLVEATLEYLRTHRPEPMTVVEGGARGADRLAGQWAARMRANGVGWVRFSAEWERHGKRAGPIRNQAMLVYVLQGREMGQTVGVVAFHDDLEASKGTRDMVTRATKAGVPVKVVTHARP
jgi:hypothetical protein